MPKALDSKLYSLIERVVTSEDMELVHAEFSGDGRNTILRVYIDKPTGITHQDCSYISNQLGTVLDVEDLIAIQYVLEVSSPGVDRALYKLSDYVRFSGQTIKLKTRQPINNRRAFRGLLEGVEEEKIKLVDGKESWLIPFDIITSANLVVSNDELFHRAKIQEQL